MTYEHWLLSFTIAFSACETVVTIYFYRKAKKKLDDAHKRATIAAAEYEAATKQLNIWSNAT